MSTPSPSQRSGNSVVLDRLDVDGNRTRFFSVSHVGPSGTYAGIHIPPHSLFPPVTAAVDLESNMRELIRRAMGNAGHLALPGVSLFGSNNRPVMIEGLSDAVSRARASASNSTRDAFTSLELVAPPDTAVPDAKPSRTIDAIVNQMRNALEEVKDPLAQFSNIVSHMPDINNGDRGALKLFISHLDTLRAVANRLSISEASWKQEWEVFFVSLRESDSVQLPLSDCCVCMELNPVIDVCRSTGEPHFLCSACLLSHYWVSTDECTRSSAKCPLCRSPISLLEIVERMSLISK